MQLQPGLGDRSPNAQDRLRGLPPKTVALNGDLCPFGRGSLPWLGGGFNCYESFSGHPAPEKGQKKRLGARVGPERAYTREGIGWQGHGHCLGTGNCAGAPKHKFLPFKKALLCTRSLNLKREKEWRVWCKSAARPPMCHPLHVTSTRTTGDKGTGTGLAHAPLLPKTRRFCPSRRRCCTRAPSSCNARKCGRIGARVAPGLPTCLADHTRLTSTRQVARVRALAGHR